MIRTTAYGDALLVVAVTCVLVLSGCLGGLNAAGGDVGPESTTETTAEAESAGTSASGTTEPAATATDDAETTAAGTPTTELGESGPPRTTYETHESLAADAPFPVPDPEVPEPFEFQSGLVTTLDGDESVATAYHHVENGTVENVVSIRKAENESAYDLTAGNATTVGDREARYVETDDGGATLRWQCGGYAYRVSVQQYADAFGEPELRSVAESVGCE